jgi:hypothetical protein
VEAEWMAMTVEAEWMATRVEAKWMVTRVEAEAEAGKETATTTRRFHARGTTAAAAGKRVLETARKATPGGSSSEKHESVLLLGVRTDLRRHTGILEGVKVLKTYWALNSTAAYALCKFFYVCAMQPPKKKAG